MGLKESGLRGSIRNVSTGIGAAISIDTLEAENIDNESATIRGEITALTNFGEQSEVFFEWGEDSAGLPNTTDIQEQGEVGIFTEDLTGLETGESYEFQAFGSVRDVSDEGAILSFETDDFEIAVTTLEATNVERDSATIRGEITELENFGEDAEVFFEWGEITEGLPNTTDIQLQDTVGVFTEDLTNLSEDTEHEFQAFGSVRDVSDEGVVLTFETGPAIPDSDLLHSRWDARELSGLSDSDRITNFVDVEGSNDLDDGDGSDYVASGIDSQPSARYDGSDDDNRTESWATDIDVPFAIFAVVDIQDSEEGTVFGGSGDGANAGLLNFDDSSWVLFNGSELFGGSVSTGEQIVGAVFDGTDSQIRINGSVDASGDGGTRSVEEGERFILGDRRSLDRQLEGDIGELLLYDGLPDFSEVEDYLANNWGQTIE